MARRSETPTAGALRNRRYRARIKRGEALGRFVITERLLSRLVRDRELEDSASVTLIQIEAGVARILRRYSEG
jgi:hypothetical protein